MPNEQFIKVDVIVIYFIRLFFLYMEMVESIYNPLVQLKWQIKYKHSNLFSRFACII